MQSEQRNKRVFKTFTYRGIPLEEFIQYPRDKVIEQLPCRMRRKFARANMNEHKLEKFLGKIRKAKAEAQHGVRPKSVRTHYRNCVILPEMNGAIIGVYNGKTYIDVEIRPDMIGHYLGEVSITYKPVSHGKYGATLAKVTNSKFYQANY